MSDVLTRGFRFHPTNEEVLTDYLMRKTRSPEFSCFTKTIHLYDKDPWVLLHERDPCYGEHEWYYFVTKNPLGHRKFMVDNSNGWRKRPVVMPIIRDSDLERNIMGWKSSFPFYVYNSSNGYLGPTSWQMEEFKLVDFGEWVICHLFYINWNEFYDKPRLNGIEHPRLKWDMLKQIHDGLSSSQNVPPSVFTYGFRFHPTDKELLTLYLTPKTRSSEFSCFIKKRELYAMEPWLLGHDFLQGQ